MRRTKDWGGQVEFIYADKYYSSVSSRFSKSMLID